MKNKLKLLIADAHPEKILIDTLKDYENIIYLGCLHDYNEIINCIEQNSPELIILELVLGDRDGFELIEHINIITIINKRPRIVVFTQIEQKSNIIHALELGIDYYLKKPSGQKDIERLLTLYLTSSI